MYAGAQDTTFVFHRYQNNFEDSSVNAGWLNPETIGSEVSGNHYSATGKEHPYSSGIEMNIPEDLRKKNFRITVSGSVKYAEPHSACKLVISISEHDSSVFWKGTDIFDSASRPGEWNPFRELVILPRSLPADSRVKIFVWNESGKSEIAVDNMDIYFSEMKFPSFLPE